MRSTTSGCSCSTRARRASSGGASTWLSVVTIVLVVPPSGGTAREDPGTVPHRVATDDRHSGIDGGRSGAPFGPDDGPS